MLSTSVKALNFRALEKFIPPLIHNTSVQSSFQFCSPDKLYHRGRVFTHRRPAILQPGRDQVGSHQSAAQVRQR